MNLLWALLGKRLSIELAILALVILFYEGIPGVAWISSKVPVIGDLTYLIEGRVPRAYYLGSKDEATRWEAKQLKWEADKRAAVNEVSKDYAVAMIRLRADNTRLQEVLSATQKDLEDGQAIQNATRGSKPYCPPAVPARLRNYLNAIR